VSPGEVAAILFGTFAVLVVLRIPVAFALGLACVPVFFISPRLTPSILFDQMFGSYNSFILLAVPFFLLAANLMNSAGITQRLVDLAKAMVGHLPGGLGHINVVVSMLFAGISGSSTADAAGIGSLLIPQMKKQGYDTSFSVAITACSSVMGGIIPPSILMVVWGGADVRVDWCPIPRRRRAGAAHHPIADGDRPHLCQTKWWTCPENVERLLIT